MKAIKAVWNDVVLAESNDVIVVEGNQYFPPESVNRQYFQNSETQTTCPWKGVASYMDIVVEGEVNQNACWYYPNPNKEASRFKDYFAFWKGVEIIKETQEQRNEKLANGVKTFLHQIDEDSLIFALPPEFLHNLSFFNFDNSTTACFYTDRDMVVQRVNPTFLWTFNHLEKPVGMTLDTLLYDMGMCDEEREAFVKQLHSHGWVKIPQLKMVKDETDYYFSLDVALTKHGDLDSLSGIQGQFMDITREVILSKRIEEKNEELARFNQEVQDLLDNTGQGFLAFGNNYEIHKKYSKACLTFFGKPIEQLSFLELIFPDEAQASERKEVAGLFEMLFSGAGDMVVLGDLLPKEIALNHRILELSYRWIAVSETNPSDKIMAILTDVTTEKELEAQLKADEERNQTLLKIASDRDGFLEFLRDLDRLFQELRGHLAMSPEKIDANVLFRSFHTIKGGTASYALHKAANEAHRIESQLEDIRSGSKTLTQKGIEQFQEATIHLKKILDDSLKEFSQLIPERGQQRDEKVYRVSSSKLKQIQDMLLEKIGATHLQQIKVCTEELRKQPIAPVFKKYATAAENLAENLGKAVRVELSGEDIEVDHDKVAPLFSNLIHLVRNSVDHGLESPDMRQMLNKPEEGLLKIGASQEGDDLMLMIQDDGGGIDPETIKQVALGKGIITEQWAESASSDALVELIFAPGFSTKEAVSEVSGRGVGMDAVKASIDELSGTLKVQTELDQGTTFTITVPHVN